MSVEAIGDSARAAEYATRLDGLKTTSQTLSDRIKELQKQGKTLARAAP